VCLREMGIVIRWGWCEIGDVSTGMCRKKPVNTPGGETHVRDPRDSFRIHIGNN